tara:strand:- start:1070 stop:1414 length:345 start_codon:yes stop_codon:yes gene_type:complete
MKNILLIFISLFLISCDKEKVTEEFLLDTGYEYFICDELTYIDDTFIIYNEVENIDPGLSMLISRCNKEGCKFEEPYDNKVICQEMFEVNKSALQEKYEDTNVLTFNIKKKESL